MRAIPGPGGERAPRIAAARAHLGNGEWLLATAVQPTGDQPRDDDKPKRRIRRDVFGAFRPPPTWDTDIQRVEYVMPPPELAARGLRTGVMMLAGGIDEDATWQAQREHDRQYGTGRHAPKCKLVRWSKDMPYTAAWEKESIDLNSAERKFSIIIDIDDEDAQHRLLSAIADHLLPAANWFVRRKEGGKGHAVWVLAEPLHTGPGARLKPQQAAYCVFQYFCEVLGGDTRYLQRQTHNPVYKGKRAHEYEVFWMATTPYSLKELLTWLPDDWQPAPRAKRKKRGGSQALYIDGMKWAGRWANRDLPAIEELERLNDSYDTPATDEIVEALAEHIEAERNVWRTRPEGWHSAEFLALQAARGRKGGLASGQSRDRRNAERDENIADYIAEGHTQAQAARHFGYSQSTICKAVKAHRRRSDEQKRTTAPPETAPPPRETRRIDEANDPPPKGESSPFPSSSPVCVSDRARDSQDRARLRRGGGARGGAVPTEKTARNPCPQPAHGPRPGPPLGCAPDHRLRRPGHTGQTRGHTPTHARSPHRSGRTRRPAGRRGAQARRGDVHRRTKNAGIARSGGIGPRSPANDTP